jgi:hypothetical protein
MGHTHERGAVLRSWRERQDPEVKRRPLARLVGCDAAYLRRFEAGQGDVSVPIATALSRETGLPLEILLSEKQLETLRGAARLLGAEKRPRNAVRSKRPRVKAPRGRTAKKKRRR